MYQLFHYADHGDDGDNDHNPEGGRCGADRCPYYALTTTDLTTLRVTAIYHLAMPGDHAGGVVATHGYIYTGYGTTLYQFDLDDPASRTTVYDPTTDPGENLPPVYTVAHRGSVDLDPADLHPNASVSALAYHDGSMYAMGFYEPEKGDAPTANSILVSQVLSTGEVKPATTWFDVPLSFSHNQGMTPVPGAPGCFLLSQSAGALPDPRTTRIGHWCAGQSSVTVVSALPGGSENIAVGPDGMVWIQNENSAHRYQKRSSNQWWDRLTPYVAGIPLSSLAPPP
jgi:hypothetical protein